MRISTLKKRIEEHTRYLSVRRDQMRKLHDDIDELEEAADEAIENLEAAIDHLSRVV